MVRKTKEEALQTRKQIFVAALDLFCERGFSKTSFQDIAKRIGLTKGAVYWYFENKQDLLSKMLLEIFYTGQEKLKLLVPEINSLDDLKQNLLEEIKIIFGESFCKKLIHFAILQMEWSDKISDETSKSIKIIMEEFKEKIITGLRNSKKKGELKEDADIEMIAILIISLRYGLFEQYLAGFHKFDIIEAMSLGFDSIIHAYKK